MTRFFLDSPGDKDDGDLADLRLTKFELAKPLLGGSNKPDECSRFVASRLRLMVDPPLVISPRRTNLVIDSIGL